jgi:hypothetical protein
MRIENERDHRALIDTRIEERNTVETVTTTHTANDGERTLLADATGGAFTVTLPTAIGRKGRKFTVVRVNGGGNAVTVDSLQTISGSASVSLSSQWDRVTAISDNSQWIRTD